MNSKKLSPWILRQTQGASVVAIKVLSGVNKMKHKLLFHCSVSSVAWFLWLSKAICVEKRSIFVHLFPSYHASSSTFSINIRPILP
jgi:hypothetical protein